ncbi:replication-relaxation family protein [Streptomyces anulatus]|uniref:replication-relaxation family protein n=1 Tax=Streptomyces anulatus TaxID=1892 RepID=UPI00215166FA|nr:replication-relaxation family protein [Streptomyces anulatus]
MRKHGLSDNGGSTETGDTLRNLTIKGLEAASFELRRPETEMGSTARGAGSSGASHSMAVNETVIAMLRPKPNMAKLADDPARVRATARTAVDTPPGIGTIASYGTEVPLPATGTWNAPGKGGAQADRVLTAPQDGVPLLFIEVDNCHETAEELAAKLEKYARFFRRRVKDTDGKERPMWRTRWTAPADRRDVYPRSGVRRDPAPAGRLSGGLWGRRDDDAALARTRARGSRDARGFRGRGPARATCHGPAVRSEDGTADAASRPTVRQHGPGRAESKGVLYFFGCTQQAGLPQSPLSLDSAALVLPFQGASRLVGDAKTTGAFLNQSGRSQVHTP